MLFEYSEEFLEMSEWIKSVESWLVCLLSRSYGSLLSSKHSLRLLVKSREDFNQCDTRHKNSYMLEDN